MYYISYIIIVIFSSAPHPCSPAQPACPLPLVPEFTEQPSQLQGYSIHTRLSKGPRGFGFNIVGGSRPREFLQVYSVTPGGPPALNTGSRSQGHLLGEREREVDSTAVVWLSTVTTVLVAVQLGEHARTHTHTQSTLVVH